MDEKRKRVTAPRIAAALSALLVGAALYTVSGSERQGIQVKEYTEAAEAADSTIMVYMNGSDLEGDYGAATADLREMMDALRTAGQEENFPSLHVVVEAGGTILLWQTKSLTLWHLTPALWEAWRLLTAWREGPAMSLHLRSWNLRMDMITAG